MTRGTTICCSVIAFLATAALEKKSGPLPVAPVQTVWTLALNNQLTVPPVVDAARAYFSIENNRLVAYEVGSGKLLWLIDAEPVVQPAASDELIFIGEADALVALSVGDGSVVWRAEIEEPPAARLVFDNGWLMAVSESGNVRAYRASDGHLVWQNNIGAAPHGPPALDGDRLYISAVNGRVIALQVEQGAVVWERRVGGSPNEILALGDRLYVGSTDNFFYCLMTKDGRIDWRWRTGADVRGVPAADERRVYFVSLDNVLRALNRTSGGQEWMRALPFRPAWPPAVAGGSVVVAGQSATIRTFALKDGAPGTDINAGNEVAAPPSVLKQPVTGLPMLLVVTRELAKGASATLSVRSIEPPLSPIAPLPNPVMPAPTPATRQ